MNAHQFPAINFNVRTSLDYTLSTCMYTYVAITQLLCYCAHVNLFFNVGEHPSSLASEPISIQEPIVNYLQVTDQLDLQEVTTTRYTYHYNCVYSCYYGDA